MAYAQELKNLVAEIKTGHKDRTQYVSDVKEDTARMMEGHRAWIKDNKKETADLLAQYAKEMKEMAKDLKDFLAKSEDTRKKDFSAMMGGIRARIRDIKGDTADLLARYDKEMKDLATSLKDFLRKSETTRMADFKAMMKDIAADIGAIRKSVSDLLAGYKAERKEAARYWASLKGREVVAPTVVKVVKAKKRRKRRKK